VLLYVAESKERRHIQSCLRFRNKKEHEEVVYELFESSADARS
jgi:hypothetical protein